MRGREGDGGGGWELTVREPETVPGSQQVTLSLCLGGC